MQIGLTRRVERLSVTGSSDRPALLTGLVFDADGQRLTLTHARKGAKRYRYYVSVGLITGTQHKKSTAAGGLRLPAGGLDALVAQALLDLIAVPNALLDALGPAVSGASQQHALLAAGGQLAREWQQLDWLKLHEIVRSTVARVTVHPDKVRVEVATQKLFALLLGGSAKAEFAKQADEALACHTIVVPALLKRAGKEMRLVIEGDRSAAKADPILAKLIGQAVAFREQLLTSNGVGIAELAAKAGVSGSHYTRVLRLGFLAPDLLTAIAHGRQPVGLTATKLLDDTRLHLRWSQQKTALGF